MSFFPTPFRLPSPRFLEEIQNEIAVFAFQFLCPSALATQCGGVRLPPSFFDVFTSGNFVPSLSTPFVHSRNNRNDHVPSNSSLIFPSFFFFPQTMVLGLNCLPLSDLDCRSVAVGKLFGSFFLTFFALPLDLPISTMNLAFSS